jgi:glycosyltransferase involved in cell wall biosynthesis
MRRPGDSLATLALPVYNGADTLAGVVESVLAQTHPHVELVISDNASSDGTEEICRHFEAIDPRVVYQRHPTNVGLLNNFRSAADRATGRYLRWIGDSDWIHPDYLARTLECFAEDERRVLVTTQVSYVDATGATALDQSYDPIALSSSDPVERLAEMLELMTRPFTFLDPLYGVMRREVAGLPRRNLLGEDQVFAARLALEGPWGHVPAPLARRERSEVAPADLVRLLSVPRWHSHVRDVLQSREFIAWIDSSSLSVDQRRRAHAEVARLYGRRKVAKVRRGVTRLSRIGPDVPQREDADRSRIGSH